MSADAKKTATAKTDRIDPLIEAALKAAEEEAHDRVQPDGAYVAVAAINLFVYAFVAGAKFAAARLGRPA